MKKLLPLLLVVVFMGCATVTVKDVVLLPEDRIYTVPAGQVLNVMLDGKSISMSFPTDMKLVHSSILVRQEENLNTAILKKKHAEKGSKMKTGIIGSVVAIFGTILAFVLKKKK